MLKLWGRANSSNVQRPMWLLGELNIPHERIDVGGAFGRTRDAAYLAMNPNSTVPTLEDDGFTLWESNSICRYLADKYKADDWYPTEPKARAVVEQWMDWSNMIVAVSITPAFWGLIRTPADQREPAVILASAEKCEHAFGILDAQLQKHDYVCGTRPTLADISLGINTYRWLHLPWDLIGYQRPELPALRAWFERLSSRPVYQQVVLTPLT
jgi:glutathione S-transferase